MVNDKRIVYGFLFSNNFSGVICDTKTISLKYGSERKWLLIDFSTCSNRNMSSYLISNKRGFAVADDETGLILFYDSDADLVVSRAKRIIRGINEMDQITETIEKYKSKIEDFNKNDILGIKLMKEFNALKPKTNDIEQLNLF
jgi:hypothetical protein